MQTRHAGPRQVWMNAKKLLVQRSPHKRTSKRSAGHSLAARMNVRPHQYDCEHIFLWCTDSRQIVFACLPNIRRISEWRWMLFTYTSTLCFLRAFLRLHTDVDAAWYVACDSLSHGTVIEIILLRLGMRKICARWVPKLLYNKHKWNRVAAGLDKWTRFFLLIDDRLNRSSKNHFFQIFPNLTFDRYMIKKLIFTTASHDPLNFSLDDDLRNSISNFLGSY